MLPRSIGDISTLELGLKVLRANLRRALSTLAFSLATSPEIYQISLGTLEVALLVLILGPQIGIRRHLTWQARSRRRQIIRLVTAPG